MSDPLTTVEHLARARAGSASSIEALLRSHRPALLRRIRTMMGPAARRIAESEDFLHEVVMGVASSLDRTQIRGDSDFLRWATVIARNRITAATRRRHEEHLEELATRTGLLLAANPTPSGEAVVRERIEILVDMLEALSPEYREVVELRHFESLPFRAIAERLNCTENAAQLLHARALAHLGRLVRSRAAAPDQG